MQDEKTLKWFDQHGLERPTHLPHGVKDTYENPLSEQLVRLKCSNWRLEGNLLICDTDQGTLSQMLKGTDWLCKGTDDKGLPILTKIGE